MNPQQKKAAKEYSGDLVVQDGEVVARWPGGWSHPIEDISPEEFEEYMKVDLKRCKEPLFKTKLNNDKGELRVVRLADRNCLIVLRHHSVAGRKLSLCQIRADSWGDDESSQAKTWRSRFRMAASTSTTRQPCTA